MPVYRRVELGASSRSRSPTARPGSTTSRTSTTASTARSCRSMRPVVTPSSRSVASTPTRGPPQAIEIAAAAGRRLVICGIVHDEAYFHECVEPRIDGDRVTYLGSVGPRATSRGPRQRGRAPAPGRLRRAVRPVGRRVDDVRHAGDRLRARFDAGDRRRRADRLPRLETSPRPWPLSTRAAGLDRAACRVVALERFSADPHGRRLPGASTTP